MDHSVYAAGAGRVFPRRELRGTQSTSLKVRIYSDKVKKPHVLPQPLHCPPVIIYTISQKVICINSNLASACCLSNDYPALSSSNISFSTNESFSPDAQFASIENMRQMSNWYEDVFNQLGIGRCLGREFIFLFNYNVFHVLGQVLCILP